MNCQRSVSDTVVEVFDTNFDTLANRIVRNDRTVSKQECESCEEGVYGDQPFEF